MANKGEWSEVYAFFKILADGKLQKGDANLNIINNSFYKIIAIIKKEAGHNKTFSIKESNIILSDGIREDIIIPVEHFVEQTKKLLKFIKNASGSFAIEETELFLHQLGIRKIKSSSKKKLI